MWEVTFDLRPSFTMRLPSIDPPAMGLAPSPSQTYSFRNRAWSYRGEGNANLVLAVPDEHSIVRLRKCPQNEAIDSERIYREVEFSRGVMRPLLGRNFVHVPEVVRIPTWELQCLNEQLRPLRPRHRHHKSVFGEFAAIFPDLCLLPACRSRPHTPTFCVEVKPKQGWIPVPDRRLSKCTFCLNQFLKLRNGSVSERSGYCPLGLFSGDPLRMESAIRALVRCPQNNFKLFCNGTLQYGESSGSCLPVLESWFGKDLDERALLDNLCSVVVQALTRDGSDSDLPLIPETGLDSARQAPRQSRIPKNLLEKAASLLHGSPCYQPSCGLPVGCILSRILRIQQLDVYGSDEVHRLYSAAHHHDYHYVDEVVQDTLKIFEPLNSYLLATTAKDCSILITFQQTSITHRGPDVVHDLFGTPFVFNIGVSDLDPKPMNCIEKHRKRDLEVVESCIDWLNGCKAH